MAPKKNKQREKQEQNRASSSARAHERLLASMGSGGGGGAPAFVGFSSFAQQPTVHPSAAESKPAARSYAYASASTPVASTFYDGADHDIAMALKMLGKKGSVTKTKALNNLLQETLPPKKPAEVRGMVGHFVQLYSSEMRDQNDRKVRQLLNQVLRALAEKLRPKAFAAHLKRLLPYWYMAMHDVNGDVALVATQAFELLLPESEMRLAVVTEHLDAITEEYRVFLTKTPDTFEGISMQPDEREERYERCVSSAVLSIRALVELFAGAGQLDKLQDADAACSVASVVSSDKFARLTTASSKHPNFSRETVRRAAYLTVASLCTHAQSIVSAKKDSFGKAMLGAIGEKSPANAEDMWSALLTFLQTFPSVWQESPSLVKFAASAAFPRLYSQIRHGFHGSARSSFPTVLPFLSLIPLDVVAEASSGRCALYTGVLDNCLKYLESSESRFHSTPATAAFFECLTAFSTIFLNTEAATAWLGAHSGVVDGYASQFEKAVNGSFKLALSSASFSDEAAGLYVAELLKMQGRIRSYSAKSDAAAAIKDALAQRLLDWMEKSLLAMVADLSIQPGRASALIENGLCQGDASADSSSSSSSQFWSSLCRAVYRTALEKLHACIAQPDFSATERESLLKLLSLIKALYSSVPTALLVGDESADEHFAANIRPAIRGIAGRATAERAAWTDVVEQLIVICRSFLLAAADKKAFLLQLFQDLGVLFGDMAEATAVVRHALQFPLTPARSKLWSLCGSWQPSDAAAADVDDPVVDALTAIWQGKLLDEFLLISLKGRLDDLSPAAFQRLLVACLGGAASCPLVSPDAVVIFCHLAVQHGSESPELLVVILEQFCGLFAKLGAELPRELQAVEAQLYTQLFHLSARGSYAAASDAIWTRTAKQTMQRWSAPRLDAFTSGLAAHVNALLVAPPSDSAAFNDRLVTAYATKLLLLSADPAVSASAVASKLDIVHARSGRGSQQALFFTRLLGCLGSVCEDERAVAVLAQYYAELAAAREADAARIVAKLVDIDVAHAMTWFVFHPHASRADWGRPSSRVEVLESYLALEPLYEALRETGIMDAALALAAARASSSDRAEMDAEMDAHRNVLLAAKGDEPDVRDLAAIPPDERLTRPQHDELDVLVLGATCLYASRRARAALAGRLSAAGLDARNAALLAPVLASLAKDLAQPKEADAGEDASEDAGEDAGAQALRSFVATMEATEDEAALPPLLGVATGCLRHLDGGARGSDALGPLLAASALGSALDRVRARASPASSSVVDASEWVAMAEFVSALPPRALAASDALRPAWEQAARALVAHAVAGRQAVAKVASLKMQRRSQEMAAREALDDARWALAYPLGLARARLAMLVLLGALARGGGRELLLELSAAHREALLSTVLCAFAEAAELRARVVSAYVSLGAPAPAFRLVQLSMAAETALESCLSAAHAALASVGDLSRVRELVLEALGGVDGLAALLDASRYPLTPAQRVLLYTVASHAGALRPARPLADEAAIDLDAADEAAIEASLARALIPRALRKALRASFGAASAGADAAGIRMRSRRQKPREREDLVGRLLLWDAFLQLFPRGAGGRGDEGDEDKAAGAPAMEAAALSAYAARHKLLAGFLTFCTALLSQESAASLARTQAPRALDMQSAPLFALEDLAARGEEPPAALAALGLDKRSVFALATRVFLRTAVRLPAMVRAWWNDECSRSERSWAAKYFEEHISPWMLTAELEGISAAAAAGAAWDADEMTVKGSRVSREITTTYVKDECALEMVIRVPPAYPLRCVEVECTKRIGIAEDRWRRWVLQIVRVTAAQDGSLLDAVLLWKRNVDKEFEGVEPCPICYSILNPKTMGLPNLPCKTCANKYHNSCLYKWFNQSGKNKCPICQQPFY